MTPFTFKGAPVTQREIDLMDAVVDGFTRSLVMAHARGDFSEDKLFDITGRAASITRAIVDGDIQPSSQSPRLNTETVQ